MGISSACRPSVHPQMIFAFSCLMVVMGCDSSDGQAILYAKSCQEAGVTGDELKACTSSNEGYRRVMEPITARHEREEVLVFNTSLRALPSRSIPKERYEIVSLEVLKKYKCCFGDFTDAVEAPRHPLFGKRLVVQGRIVYLPTDYENKNDEHQWLELQDSTKQEFTWQLEADLESLSREERAYIRANCAIDDCTGKFYGVIGRLLKARGLEVLGLQIEHIELSPRELKKTP